MEQCQAVSEMKQKRQERTGALEKTILRQYQKSTSFKANGKRDGKAKATRKKIEKGTK